MNRKERRRAKGLLRHQHRATEVHEAGHGVSRIMTAESLGWPKEEAIESIDINSPSSVGRAVGPSVDGTVALATLATTHGPFLSRPMDEFLRARMPERFAAGGSIQRKEIAQAITEMRAAGVDVEWWYRAKSIEGIFGPMAEAKYLGVPFDDVWHSHSAEADVRDIVANGLLCGLSTEQIGEATGENIGIAQHFMAQPEVWRPILALAERLKSGRTKGSEAAAVVLSALQPDAA